MSKFKLTQAALLFTAGLAFTAVTAAPNTVPSCKSTRPVRPAEPVPSLTAMNPKAMTPVPLNAFQVIDKDIARKLVVQSVSAGRTDADTVQVGARIFNCSSVPLRVLARTQFMDATQRSTEPVSAWRLLIVEPHGFADYQERSIGTMSAAAFLIEARSANP